MRCRSPRRRLGETVWTAGGPIAAREERRLAVAPEELLATSEIRRPPSSVALRWRPDDRGGAASGLHVEGTACLSACDGPCPGTRSRLRARADHRRSVLRLQAQPDRGRAERDRAAPDPRLP